MQSLHSQDRQQENLRDNKLDTEGTNVIAKPAEAMDIQSDIVVNTFVHQQASLHQLHHPHLSQFQKGFPHLHASICLYTINHCFA